MNAGHIFANELCLAECSEQHGVSEYTSFRNHSEKSGDRGRHLEVLVVRINLVMHATMSHYLGGDEAYCA